MSRVYNIAEKKNTNDRLTWTYLQIKSLMLSIKRTKIIFLNATNQRTHFACSYPHHDPQDRHASLFSNEHTISSKRFSLARFSSVDDSVICLAIIGVRVVELSFVV